LQQYQPTTIITKQGECEITLKLELNININSNGGVNVSATSMPVTPSARIPLPPEEESINWAIPDFRDTEKIQFGKNVRE
jgi:hypothetical protein